MKTIIVDPFPRKMELIFKSSKLKLLKKNFNIINAPKENKHKFYKQNIPNADFIIGQPDLPKSILILGKKLKAIFNVESNFMDNMDYDYCFNNNIYVLSTAPVFAQSVAEIAIGLTISLKREIHTAHLDFIQKKEKYGLESNKRSNLLLNNKIGIVGFGDLAKSLKPMLVPYTSDFLVYDPWLPNKLIEDNGCRPASLSKIFKNCEVIYILTTITKKTKT